MAPDGGSSSDLEHRLVAISGSGPNDLWAVGSRFADENSRAEPLIEHWNGVAWTSIAVPASAQLGDLTDVAVVAADDAWAVSWGAGILHWDGMKWSVVQAPRFGPKGRELDALAAVSADSVWALGSYVLAGGNSIRRDLFEHWNGSRWRIVPSPQVDPKGGTGGMQDVAANLRGDVWAVGGRVRGFGEAGRLSGALVERFGPAGWVLAQAPIGKQPVTLLSVSPSGSVWAATGTTLRTVGEYGVGKPQRVMRWDGHRWTVTQTLSGDSVTGVAASGGSVWVVGQSSGFRRQRLFLESWNGARWARVPLGPAGHMAPVHSEYENRTPAVAVTGDGSVVVLDTEGLPSSGQRNYVWTRCAVAGGGGRS